MSLQDSQLPMKVTLAPRKSADPKPTDLVVAELKEKLQQFGRRYASHSRID